METSTRQDKLLFFGITFITLAALMFITNYVFPFLGSRLDLLFIVPFVLSLIIIVARFGYKKGLENYKSKNTYLISGIAWSIIAGMDYLKYFNENNFNWITASLSTFVAIVSWVNYFKRSKKISN